MSVVESVRGWGRVCPLQGSSYRSGIEDRVGEGASSPPPSTVWASSRRAASSPARASELALLELMMSELASLELAIGELEASSGWAPGELEVNSHTSVRLIWAGWRESVTWALLGILIKWCWSASQMSLLMWMRRHVVHGTQSPTWPVSWHSIKFWV